ncbi:MAG: transglutaminase family protein [Deltaproteobacteria bacterium]|nr:transglutaminase family protein [Deltaproteobacteria bacterium]
MMLLEIEHQLTFQYDTFVNESYTELRVEPRRTPHQTLQSFYLAVGPPTAIWRYIDWNGNFVHHFGIPNYHDRIEVATRSLVETHPSGQALADATDTLPIADATGPLLDFTTFGGPVIRSFELEMLHREAKVPTEAPLGEQIKSLSAFVLQRFDYVPEVSDYRSTTDHLLAAGAGVCQDFAHVLIGLLRLRGIPSRYVSGYLHVESGGNEPSQSHAWVEAWSPTAGWLAVDPTHDQILDERYVVVAHGRDYDDVPPNRGIYRGKAGETLHASVRTRQSEERQTFGLQDEIGELDVPVFPEVPHSPQTPSASLTDDDPQSQQQQQQ